MCELRRNSDVLLGKGKPIQEYTGNRRLHGIVDEQLSICHGFEDNKKEKTSLSAEIVVEMVQRVLVFFCRKKVVCGSQYPMISHVTKLAISSTLAWS
jgi:hypothetical protein